MPTPTDLFLSPDLTEEDAREYLRSLGFHDPAAADLHLQMMADDPIVRETLGRVAPLLLPALLESPDPNAAVVGLQNYLAARTGKALFLDYLREDPRALHVLTYLLGVSPLLSGMLVRNPEYFHWLMSQIDRSAPDRQDIEEGIAMMLDHIKDPAEALRALRRWKLRETMRIAARDLLRRETVQTARGQISDLACVTVDAVLSIVTGSLLDGRAEPPGDFAVVALGDLAGDELSYSAGIDLIYVYEGFDRTAAESTRDFFQRLAQALTEALCDDREEDCLYRVNLRPRPGGDSNNLVQSLDECAEYYRSPGDTSERLALLKARPIAGNESLGRRFLERLQPFVYRPALGRAAVTEVEAELHRDGIRQLELLTNLFQLAYGDKNPSLRQPGTLGALDALVRAALVPPPVHQELAHAFVFLSSVEQRLQLTNERPDGAASDAAAFDAASDESCARRVGLGSAEDLEKQLRACRDRVRRISLDALASL